MQQSRTGELLAVLLIGIALLVRLGVWFAHHDSPDSFLEADSLSYLQPGRQLLVDGTFPSFMRTPIYPLFLAILDRLAPGDPGVWVLAQVLISLGSMGVAGYLAWQVFGWPAAVIALLFVAGDVTSAIAANQLMSETVFTFLLMSGLLGVWYVWQRPQAGVAVYALVGFSFGVLTLCRPIGLLLFAVVACWLLVALEQSHRRVRIVVLIFCATALLLPAAWMVRNRFHTGEYFLSTIVATNLYQYRAAWNEAQLSNRSFDEVHREFATEVERHRQRSGMNAGQLAKWERDQAIELLAAHPLLTLRQGADGLIKMYLGISVAGIEDLAGSGRQHGLADAKSLLSRGGRQLADAAFPWWVAGIKVWAGIYLLLLYSSVLGCGASAVRRRNEHHQRWFVALCLLIIAYFTFFSVGAEAYSRFRVPIAPLLSMLAGAGSVAIARWLSRLRSGKILGVSRR